MTCSVVCVATPTPGRDKGNQLEGVMKTKGEGQKQCGVQHPKGGGGGSTPHPPPRKYYNQLSFRLLPPLPSLLYVTIVTAVTESLVYCLLCVECVLSSGHTFEGMLWAIAVPDFQLSTWTGIHFTVYRGNYTTCVWCKQHLKGINRALLHVLFRTDRRAGHGLCAPMARVAPFLW